MGSPLICARTRADPVQPRAREWEIQSKEISFERLAPLRYIRFTPETEHLLDKLAFSSIQTPTDILLLQVLERLHRLGKLLCFPI